MSFKTTTLAFVLSILVLGSVCYFTRISYWWLLIPVFIYKAFIIYGSATIQSGFFLNAINSSSTSKKVFALTFDDGPDINYTPEILKVLDEHQASATFFVIGKKINGNENLLKQMDTAGHTLGNHSFSHSFFIDFKSTHGFIRELNDTSTAIFKVIGKRTQLFRPPYGVTTPNLAKASSRLKYQVIGWSLRSLDTTSDSIDKIVGRVKLNLKPGSIILLHDTSFKTIEVLKQTLSFAMQEGYQCVSLEQLLNIKAYA